MIAPQNVGLTDVPDDVAQGRGVVLYRLSRGALTLVGCKGSQWGLLRRLRSRQPCEIVLVAPGPCEPEELDAVAHVVLGVIYDTTSWAGTLRQRVVYKQQWGHVGTPVTVNVVKVTPQAA